MRAPYRILFHFTGAVLTLGLLIWLIFYVFLPTISFHRETVTVPNTAGMHIEDLRSFLSKRNLSFKVASDSDFSIEHPPLTVLKQIPLPGHQIKVYRKMIITLNATQPPYTTMPQLVDGSVKNAQILLKSHGLRLGTINYVDDLAQNAVIAQYWKKKPIEAQHSIFEGAQIDLDVGNGLGRQIFTAPNLLGININEAEVIVISSGLRVGHKVYQPEGTQRIYRKDPTGDSVLIEVKVFAPGLVIAQDPSVGTEVRIGDYLDLWISGDPLTTKQAF